MPYTVGLIIMIMTRVGGIILEALMRDRLDDFNRCSSTPELCSSKKMPTLYHKSRPGMQVLHSRSRVQCSYPNILGPLLQFSELWGVHEAGFQPWVLDLA